MELKKGLLWVRVYCNPALIPDVVGQVIAVGEESGTLGDALGEIADNYEQDIGDTMRTLTSLIEPVMILLVGLVIGFMVFAMLLPIFHMDIMAR